MSFDSPRIAILAFTNISAFHLSVPQIVFDAIQPNPPLVSICAESPGLLVTDSKMKIFVEHGLEALENASIIIIPSWHNVDEPPSDHLQVALHAAHNRGAQLVGLCLGSYVLAAMGILNNRQATTHWAYKNHFQQRFPLVDLRPDILYVGDTSIVTSAGVAAGLDCCIHLVREYYGTKTANAVARQLVVPPHRSGGQAQFIQHPIEASASDQRLGTLLTWILENLKIPHNLDSLSKRVMMNRRTFTRHFRRVTGTSVSEWITQARLNFSQELLENTNHSIELIADLSGFRSTTTFRKVFKQTFGVSPNAWRLVFKGK